MSMAQMALRTMRLHIVMLHNTGPFAITSFPFTISRARELFWSAIRRAVGHLTQSAILTIDISAPVSTRNLRSTPLTKPLTTKDLAFPHIAATRCASLDSRTDLLTIPSLLCGSSIERGSISEEPLTRYLPLLEIITAVTPSASLPSAIKETTPPHLSVNLLEVGSVLMSPTNIVSTGPTTTLPPFFF